MSQYASISENKQTMPAAMAINKTATEDKSAKHNHQEIKRLPIQFKLAVGAVDDPLEHEADTMANKVMRMPEQKIDDAGQMAVTQSTVNSNIRLPTANYHLPSIDSIQRKCSHCEEEENDGIAQRKPLVSFIQKKENGKGAGTANDAVASQINATKGSGSNMDGKTQSFMESRFGTGFQDVRIHTGGYASDLSQQLNAKAFTVCKDIYFNSNAYNPQTESGKHLLAHELTHTIQQNDASTIRKWDFTHLSEAEQEEYYRVMADADFLKVLGRMEKGELDDNDLKNARLYNRLTGLTTTKVNALITKIKAYQVSHPAVVTTKIIEFLEVRKEISTPMPDNATVNRDMFNNIESYRFITNGVTVTVVKDMLGNTSGNDTGPTTSFGKSYSWRTNGKDRVVALTNNDSGTPAPINPTSFAVTIKTRYKDDPNGPSGYGKGTTDFDKEEKTTTLRSHEGKHGTDDLDYIKNNAFPVDLSKGVIGVLTAANMRAIGKYIINITKDSCELTDQVGFSQDEFLKTPAGIASGIKSCRS